MKFNSSTFHQYAFIAQSVEHVIGNDEVASSNLAGGSHGAVLVSTAMGCIRITGMQLSLNCKRKELTIISIIANYRLLDSAFAPKQYTC